MLLTLGIMLGSMWAYRELGWGGFWFWDPVENASLLPWLLLTVLLHNISITKNDYSGTALLALISFITVLLGAFLVRSGVLSSVHSFTSDPTRGAVLLSLTALVFFASMVLYALRASVLTTESSRPYLARILRLQSWVLYAITLSLFLSILLPLYAELVQQRQIMIGLPYFEHSTIPLTLPLLLLMGVANRTSWRVYLLELLAAGIITYLLLLLADPKPWLLVVFVYLAIWTTISTLLARSRLPMTVAHLGFALLVGSIAWTTTQSVEQTQLMQPGTKAEFFGWQLRYDGVKNDMQANYLARQGTVWLSGPNGQTAKLHPEVRFYPIQQQYSVESAITRFALTDVYITIGNIQADGSVTLRFFLRPAMLLVWLGGTLMLVAPLLAWFKRRDIICKNRPNVA